MAAKAVGFPRRVCVLERDAPTATSHVFPSARHLEMIVDLHTPNGARPPSAGDDCPPLRPDNMDAETRARAWLASDRHTCAWSGIVRALTGRRIGTEPEEIACR